MHQWESLKKLISTWEDQEVKDTFVYAPFEYKADEWDNVPPVIPRFSFYVQNCLAKTVEFTKEVHERQTTQDLKDEMYRNLAEHKKGMDTETAERRSDVADATKRKDRLQKAIDDLGKYNDDTRAENQVRGQEDLGSN